MKRFPLLLAGLLLLASFGNSAEPLKVLLIDGQNNHNWRATSPVRPTPVTA